MVTIIAYHVRKNKEGKEFITLDLQGDITFVQSLTTGSFFATAKKCSITSTFSVEVAKTLIGKEIPGRVDRVACDPYDYTVPETGEVITLMHRWEYRPNEAPVPAVPMYAIPGGVAV